MVVHLMSWLLAFCLLAISIYALPTPIDTTASSSVPAISTTTASPSLNVEPRQVAFTGEVLTSTEGFFIFVTTRSVTASTVVASTSTIYNVETRFTTFTVAGDTSTVTTTTTTTVPAAAARASIAPRDFRDPRDEHYRRAMYPRQATTITTYTSTQTVQGYTTMTYTSTLATVTSTDLGVITVASTRVETVLDTARPLQFVSKTEVVTVTAERPPAESTAPSVTAAETVAETTTSTTTTPSSSTPTSTPESATSTTPETTSSTKTTTSDTASSTQSTPETTTSAGAPTTTIIITTGQGQVATEPSSSGLSREAQIGIGVGVGALMVVITLLGVACLIHRRKHRDPHQAFHRGGGGVLSSDTSGGETQMSSSAAGVAAFPTSPSHGGTRPELHGRSRSELHGETVTKSSWVWSGGSWSTVAAGGGYAATADARRESGNGQWYPATNAGGGEGERASPPPDANGFVASEGGGYWHNRHGWQKGPAELDIKS